MLDPLHENIFSRSQVSLVHSDTCEPVDDILHMALEKSLNDECVCINLATYLVTGHWNIVPRTNQEHYDIIVMNLVLDYSQSMKDLDIHKVFDFPFAWLKRWTEVMEEAEATDAPSTDTLNEWFGVN